MKSNPFRFYELLKKAEAGEDITIGFLGGSITQGSLSSSPKTCYAYLVYRWWKETFPQAKVHYVNAGIGGTTSLFGSARVWDDLLRYRPDFVMVDFSVNDDPNTFFQETYEGLIRRLFSDSCEPVLMALGNVYYDTGISAEDYHRPICHRFEIPYVSVKEGMYGQIVSGLIKRDEISPDGLHPNDKGHAAIARQITNQIACWMQEVMDGYRGGEEDTNNLTGSSNLSHPLQKFIEMPECLTANYYEETTRNWISNLTPSMKGFRTDHEERTGHLDLWSNGWIGKTPGAVWEADINGSCIAIQYRKRPTGKSPVVKVILDQVETAVLDGNFEEDWGDCLYLQPILHHGTDTLYHLRLEILEDEGVTENFYLNSIITA